MCSIFALGYFILCLADVVLEKTLSSGIVPRVDRLVGGVRRVSIGPAS